MIKGSRENPNNGYFTAVGLQFIYILFIIFSDFPPKLLKMNTIIYCIRKKYIIREKLSTSVQLSIPVNAAGRMFVREAKKAHREGPLSIWGGEGGRDSH